VRSGPCAGDLGDAGSGKAFGAGLPTRAEVTDAAMSVRAECVMLNKGPEMVAAVRALDNILRRMQTHQNKKQSMLRSLKVARNFNPARAMASPVKPPRPMNASLLHRHDQVLHDVILPLGRVLAHVEGQDLLAIHFGRVFHLVAVRQHLTRISLPMNCLNSFGEI